MEEKVLRKSSILKLISELEKYESKTQDMLTAYLTPQSILLEKLPETIRDDIENFLRKSSLGLISFYWNEKINLIIFPPFPIKDEIFFENRFRTEQLKEILTKKYKLGIILLRLGEYAIGIFEGDKLIKSKCGKRLVRARHRKGGFSQARFARIREIQVKKFFDEAYSVLKKFEPYIDKIDHVFFGGTKITIKKFLKRDELIKKIKERSLDRILDVKEINKRALEKILSEVWRIRVTWL